MKDDEKSCSKGNEKEEKKEKLYRVLQGVAAFCFLLCAFAFCLELNSYMRLKRECVSLQKETPTGIVWYEAEPTSDSEPLAEDLQAESREDTAVYNGTASSQIPVKQENTVPQETAYILNKSSKKIHKASCHHAQTMKEENKQTVSANELPGLLEQGYTYCKVCCKEK